MTYTGVSNWNWNTKKHNLLPHSSHNLFSFILYFDLQSHRYLEVKDLYDHLCLKKGLWMELVFKIMIYIINMTDFIWSYIFTCLEAIIERMSKLRSVRYMYVFLLGLNGCGCYKYENTSEKTNKNKKFNVKNWYFS